VRKVWLAAVVGIIAGLLLWKVRQARRPVAADPVAGEWSAREADSPAKTAVRRGASVPKFVDLAPEPPPSEQNARPHDEAGAAPSTSNSLSALFRSEARDPVWAPEREAAIEPLVTRDLQASGLHAELAKVECRQFTCQLIFSSKEPEQLKQVNRFMQYALLGSVYEPGTFSFSQGTGYFSMRVAFDATERGAEAWRRGYDRRRKERLDVLRRDGVPPGYPPLPADLPPASP
jgi:hypothetical protein